MNLPIYGFVDNFSVFVDGMWTNPSRFFPQVRLIHEWRISPTCGGRREWNSHILGRFALIHIIHTPYYYY
jgi:hypothetical protein